MSKASLSDLESKVTHRSDLVGKIQEALTSRDVARMFVRRKLSLPIGVLPNLARGWDVSLSDEALEAVLEACLRYPEKNTRVRFANATPTAVIATSRKHTL